MNPTALSDTFMPRLMQAIEVSFTGDKEKALQAFEALLPALSEDPLHQCIFAHYMADLQPATELELNWDLKSLDYLKHLSDERLKEFHADLSIDGFYPSIYLNIAECYRKLNEREQAQSYIELAESHLIHLNEDGYGRMIKLGIQSLKGKLIDV